ncbi:MAG: NifB/NifX family molybdenum-iron cluster-binding protein [Bdellovibrionales bacterium]
MKIAFSTSGKDLSAMMDPRFGRAAAFLIYDTQDQTFSVIENAFATAGQGAGIKAAETIVKAGASSLVTGDCGPKAMAALKQAGVRVYSAKECTIEAAVKSFTAGSLPEIAAA